jgi:hypothetical protein
VSAIEPDVPPDQRAFEADANAPTFLAGLYRGDWNIDSVSWPSVQITIAAAPREGAPSSFTLRCDLTNYPAQAPTATPWDPDTDTLLAQSKRPKGERVGMVFRSDWEQGRALYAPYDRVALAGHPGWATDHPRYMWTGAQDLAWWVERIYDLLNRDDYEGI